MAQGQRSAASRAQVSCCALASMVASHPAFVSAILVSSSRLRCSACTQRGWFMQFHALSVMVPTRNHSPLFNMVHMHMHTSIRVQWIGTSALQHQCSYKTPLESSEANAVACRWFETQKEFWGPQRCTCKPVWVSAESRCAPAAGSGAQGLRHPHGTRAQGPPQSAAASPAPAHALQPAPAERALHASARSQSLQAHQ